MWYTILLFAALLGFILWGLIVLSKRVRYEQEVNKGIYQKEAESRTESFKITNPYTDLEPLPEDSTIEPEGEETEITSWDLDDIDRMYESHMNF